MTTTQVPKPIIRRGVTAPNEAFVVISRSVRGRVAVQDIVNGIIEPITEENEHLSARNVTKQEGSTVSLAESSPVSTARRSREAEEDDDTSKADYATRSSGQSSYNGSNTDIVGSKSSAAAGASNTASLTMKRLKKRRSTVVDKAIADTNAGNKESVARVGESSVQFERLPTLPLAADSASRHSNVEDTNKNCSTNTPKLPRMATLVSVAQKVLTVRKSSRSAANQSFTRAFEFSYFDRIIRS